MIILGPTLSNTEQERILQKARKHANSLHLSDPRYPIGERAVPPIDPEKDYNSSAKRWGKNNFIVCIKAVFKQDDKRSTAMKK